MTIEQQETRIAFLKAIAADPEARFAYADWRVEVFGDDDTDAKCWPALPDHEACSFAKFIAKSAERLLDYQKRQLAKGAQP